MIVDTAVFKSDAQNKLSVVLILLQCLTLRTNLDNPLNSTKYLA